MVASLAMWNRSKASHLRSANSSKPTTYPSSIAQAETARRFRKERSRNKLVLVDLTYRAQTPCLVNLLTYVLTWFVADPASERPTRTASEDGADTRAK